MTMLHTSQLALIFLAGTALGLYFFGGLAWTVRRLVSGGGAMLVLASFLLRSTVVLAGFWLLSRSHPDGWIACLLGFTAAKLAIQRAMPVRCWSLRRKEAHASHD